MVRQARSLASFSLCAVLLVSSSYAEPPKEASPLAGQFGDNVRVLAADDMEGRGLGTKGIDRAAAWIEGQFKAMKLAPAFGASFRQPFDIKTGVALEEGNRFDGLAADEWTPLGFSSSGDFSGELAFVGYGIDAPPIGYSDLSGIDLKGKVALMLRYEPQERDDASPFDGKRPSRWSAMRYKVLQARERGAVAVIFVNGPLQADEKDRVPALKNDGPESPAGIPVIQVKTSTAQRLLGKAGVNLAEFQNAVDRDLKARSVGSTGQKISGHVGLRAEYAATSNVAAILPGKGALANDILVIGAHYDHLGYGGERSMKPNEHAVHSGADDNASGTSAVLVAASRLQKLLAKSDNHRTIAFALFSGEEVGLAGSSYFVGHAPFDLKRVTAMINLDMVGQLRDGQLAALGADSAPEWASALDAAATRVGLKVSSHGDGYGPSDQTAFFAERIPVVHFFTGTHDKYHSPADKADTLNNDGGGLIAELTAQIANDIALGSVTPKYTRAVAAPAMDGDSRGYGAYLGTVPDYRAMEATEGGVLLSDVRPGGPADLAGIRGGDRIISMAGTRIQNLYDMTYALQDHKPGDTVEVVVIREGKELKLKATLGSRAQRNEAPKSDAKKSPEMPPAAAPKAPAVSPAPPDKPKDAVAPAAAAPAPPAAAAPPAPPPGMGAMTGEKPAVDFYAERPGEKFVVNAGKPFAKTFEGEKHFKDVRQLTFGGENAEAYFDPTGTKLILQSTVPGSACDQQFVLDLGTGVSTQVSHGGRTTCGYFDWPEGDRIVYGSTVGAGSECPPPPDRTKGYVWAVYDSFDIYEANPDGSNPKKLTEIKGYDAEMTWCHRGGKAIFTSDRDGDLDLYEMDEAGNVKRLTNTPGYDGGAFYSPDCREIVWRASRPEGDKLKEFQALLAEGLVRPKELEIFLMNADGSNVRKLTDNGAANFCPYFTPDGKKIIYSSNAGSTDGREFDVWMVEKSGGTPERLTTASGFDGFPMFSPDGRYIVWGSNRADPESHSTNIFVAKWVE